MIETEEKLLKNEKKTISKEIDKKSSTKIFINLIIAVVIMGYFCLMSVVYKNFLQSGIVNVVKVATLVFLGITLVLIEIAYKKESTRFFIHALEALALAIHSLTTMHIIKIYNFDFQTYILASSYIFSIYYVLKTIVINTKERSKFLKELSDIPEIVKKEEPRKKEASKKEIVEEIKEVKETKVVKPKNKKTKNVKNKKKEVDEPKVQEKDNKKIKEEETEENLIKSIRAKLDKLQGNKEEKQVAEKVEIEPKAEQEINKEAKPKKKRGRPRKEKTEEQAEKVKEIKEENKEKIKEEQEEPKPKRKRGRPKKEVKVND